MPRDGGIRRPLASGRAGQRGLPAGEVARVLATQLVVSLPLLFRFPSHLSPSPICFLQSLAPFLLSYQWAFSRSHWVVAPRTAGVCDSVSPSEHSGLEFPCCPESGSLGKGGEGLELVGCIQVAREGP